MRTEFKRDLNNNYMILDGEPVIEEDYKIRMFVSNQIPSMLKCNIRRIDGTIRFYYEITSRQPMSRIYEKKLMKASDIYDIISSFLRAITAGQEYLLEGDDFILDPEYIYMEPETNQVYFCYMPGYRKDIAKSFHELASYILERVDHQDRQAVADAYEMYRHTTRDNYSVKEVLLSIHQENKMEAEEEKEPDPKPEENIEAVSEHEPKKSGLAGKVYMAVMAAGILIVGCLLWINQREWIEGAVLAYLTEEAVIKLAGACIVAAAVFAVILMGKRKRNIQGNTAKTEEYSSDYSGGRTEDLGSGFDMNQQNVEYNMAEAVLLRDEEEVYGSTMLLSARDTIRKLIPLKELYNSFELTGPSFTIGKMADRVDGVIADNMISRIHAEIICDGERYFLSDLNSTNGTYHNNRRLEANESVELKVEDSVRFGRAEFIFR